MLHVPEAFALNSFIHRIVEVLSGLSVLFVFVLYVSDVIIADAGSLGVLALIKHVASLCQVDDCQRIRL